MDTLINFLLKYPKDRETWLVYADWLQTQGDLRGEQINHMLNLKIKHNLALFYQTVLQDAWWQYWSYQDKLGPEMIIIPEGEFMIGSPLEEKGRQRNEKQKEININYNFAISRTPITINNFNFYSTNFNSNNYPINEISLEDCEHYCTKLSKQSHSSYRLPTEAEWEYCARAGLTTPFIHGQNITTNQANFNNSFTLPVKYFQANPWGLYQIHGNIWEITCSEYQSVYQGQEMQCCKDYDKNFALRGGNYDSSMDQLRLAYRSFIRGVERGFGFRVVQLLD